MNFNHRLYEVFNSLDSKELRQLSKYLQSPLFNKQDIVYKLFLFMRKNKDKGWNKEVLFNHLHPNKTFDMQLLHYTHSHLLKHIESYLVWKESTQSDINYHLHLLKAYREKHLEKAFDRTMKQLEQVFEKEAIRNESYHSHQYFIQREAFYLQRERGRNIEFNLQELSDIQDIAFIADKLKNACTILSHQSISKNKYDQGLLQSVLKKVESEKRYLEFPAISIYYYAYKSLSDVENEKNYYSLKALVDQYIMSFTQQEKRDIYILTANYCIRRLNTGDKAFIREAFETYRQGLEKDVLIEHGLLSRWTYNNIIVLGLKLNEFEWVETFIYQYKDYLEEKIKEDSFNFNLAKFYFEKKDYNKTMPLLLQTKYDDLLHNLGAKTMLAKMYFELQEWDALESLLESFKIYISRKKNIGYHKENYLNIIFLIKKIMKVNPFNKEEKAQLQKNISETKVLTEREWLLEQVDRL